MSFQVEVAPAARRQIRAFDRTTQARIIRAIGKLSNNPRTTSCKKLEGEESLCRIRVGDYQVIYTVRDFSLLVLVLKVGHRGDIYRRR